MKRPIKFWLATGFGVGLLKGKLKIGGGTWGSIAAMMPVIGVMCLCQLEMDKTAICTLRIFWVVSTLTVLFVGVASVPVAERLLGERRNWRGYMVRHDQSQIVIDEVLGVMISATPLLWFGTFSVPIAAILVFGLFRFYDITKLPPIKLFDRWESPWGVMLDDVLAGLYSAATLVAIRHFWSF